MSLVSRARAPSHKSRQSLDFWKFWIGETTSSLGGSFTQYALPLLIFKLTGSALTLGVAFAVSFLPYLLFSLVIGAWVDRLDRKRVMIVVDFGQMLVIAAIPTLFLMGVLTIWWVYAVAFVSATLKIFTDSCQFAAIPSLVDQSDLVTANGRIQASFYGATVLGPVLAGLLIFVMPLPTLLLLDVVTFLVSAAMLALIRRSFHLDSALDSSRAPSSASEVRPTHPASNTGIIHEMADGLRALFGHPVLRDILIMLTLFNVVGVSRESLLVVLAEGHLHATDTQFGLLNAAGGAGVVIVSLLAGPLRKRGGYIRLALVNLQIGALAAVALAFSPSIWIALPLWAMVLGSDNLWNIYSSTLRQEILPNALLGRARAVAGMMAFGALPLGALLGGAIANGFANVVFVYAGVGVLLFVLVSAFSFPILANAQRLRVAEYAPPASAAQTRQTRLQASQVTPELGHPAVVAPAHSGHPAHWEVTTADGRRHFLTLSDETPTVGDMLTTWTWRGFLVAYQLNQGKRHAHPQASAAVVTIH